MSSIPAPAPMRSSIPCIPANWAVLHCRSWYSSAAWGWDCWASPGSGCGGAAATEPDALVTGCLIAKRIKYRTIGASIAMAMLHQLFQCRFHRLQFTDFFIQLRDMRLGQLLDLAAGARLVEP